MDDSLREKLRGLIVTHGPALTQDVPRCRDLVREVCQGKMPETKVLIDALEHQAPAHLLEAPDGKVDAGVVDRLSQDLHEHMAVTESAARWAVRSWVVALGLTDGAAPKAAFDIDPPACFYLGREYDLEQHRVMPDRFVMYDARDLTTHGVIVGMTGSGKTGLAITILEEAAIDGYPCILIDPKGDLTNLLLQFPGLDPADFEKWLDPEEARQRQQTPRQHAEELAKRWRQGLEDTYQSPDRIERLRQASNLRIYTPGSETGLPLSILSSFAAPKGDLPHEVLTHKIDATATALLGLTGIADDPIQSREHILVAQLLLHAWEAGNDLDLAGLILQIQNPPIRTVGAYNLETFFPARERLKFASALNNVLASPSFAIWTMGEPLDLSAMLYRNGRPQQVIFYIAHLDDRERMFFTTLLLEEMLNWTRRQAGSSNLRALLYFDEVYGYLPPYPANPPSKGPLLTLLKQARAFGVGILLATQNPVDLDYKALSNAGTWFIGKLQTERDKARLLEGLESVAAEQGTMTDRDYLEKVIVSLGNRVFLMHSIHRPKPLLLQSRWALSLLRGPMTREEVARLMAPLKQQDAGDAGPMAIPVCTHCHAELGPEVTDRCPSCGKRPWASAAFRRREQARRDGVARAGTSRRSGTTVTHLPPVLPAEVTQFYLSAEGEPRGELEYQPWLFAAAEVTFVLDRRKGLEHVRPVRLLASPPEAGHPADWQHAGGAPDSLAPGPAAGARWAGLPSVMDTSRKLKSLQRAFGEFLYSTQRLALFQNRTLGLVSAPGESLALFQGRCREAAVAEAEKALQMEKVKFAPKFEALGTKLPEEEPERHGGFWAWLTASVTPVSRTPSGPPTSRLEEKQRKLAGEYQAKRNEICEKWKRVGEEATQVEIKPRKIDVRISQFGIGWVPCWRLPDGKAVPAQR
jgi:hypothetical protein